MSFQNASVRITQFVIHGFDGVIRPVEVGVVLLIIYLLAVLANVVNILFVVFDKKLHKPMFILICNLAVVDFLYASSVTPTMIGVLLAGAKTISYVACLIQLYFSQLGLLLERFALTIMAFDRLLAVIYPFKYQIYLTNTRTLVLVYAAWVIPCSVIAVIVAEVVPLATCTSRLRYTFCDYGAVIRATCADHNYYFDQGAIRSFFFFSLTLTFICLSYCAILYFTKLLTSNDKRKMGSTLVSHMVCVICHYCPLLIIIVLTRVGVVLTLEARQGLLIGSILGPSLINPFVYCLRTKEMRNNIMRIFIKVAPYH
ncbi:olfactory receptor 10G4-like [Pholidichthys leucotaenia]